MNLKYYKKHFIAIIYCAVFVSGSSKVFANSGVEDMLLTMETSIAEGNTEKLHGLIDFPIFMDNILAPISYLDKRSKEGFRDGFMSSSMRLSAKLISTLKVASLVRLRLSRKNRIHHALYRIDLGDEGINYIIFYIHKNKQQEFKIVDWFQYHSSSKASESIRQVLVLMLPDANILEKFFSIVNGNKKEVRKITIALHDMRKKNDPLIFIDAFEKADESIKKNVTLSNLYLTLASRTKDEDIYKKALLTFSNYHGGNPKFALAMVDHYFYLGETEKAVKALDRVEEEIGIADPPLYVLRASIYFDGEMYAAAYAEAGKLISIDPDNEEGYWLQVNSSTQLNNYKNTLKLLKLLQSQFGYQFNAEDFKEDELYKDFIKSSEFKGWLL